jgi:hypothetical protein
MQVHDRALYACGPLKAKRCSARRMRMARFPFARGFVVQPAGLLSETEFRAFGP